MAGETQPTVTVRVSRRLVEALKPKLPSWETAKTLGEILEPWVAEQFAAVPAHLSRLLAVGEAPTPGEPRLAKTGASIRLPRWQVRRLGIVAEVANRWVGQVVEERLWDWLAGQPAKPILSASFGLDYCGTGWELCPAGAPAGRL